MIDGFDETIISFKETIREAYDALLEESIKSLEALRTSSDEMTVKREFLQKFESEVIPALQ